MLALGPRLTIRDIMRELLPNGTGDGPSTASAGEDPWSRCPPWPPDLFGVVASIADKSGCYSEAGVVMSRNGLERDSKKAAANQARKLGLQWTTDGLVPDEVQGWWADLVAARDKPVCDSGVAGWKTAAMRLLAVSDEASSGFGFVPPQGDDSLAKAVFVDLIRHDEGLAPLTCALPHSIAARIPPDRACVMPKALTPPLGCTLRSLSHNLALLPGIGTVKPLWFIGASEPGPAKNAAGNQEEGSRGEGGKTATRGDAAKERFNMLVVPFPYDLARTDFIADRQPEDGPPKVDGYFSLQQNWLQSGGERLPRDDIAHFMAELVRRAERDVGTVHAVVLPETALDHAMAAGLIEDLANIFPHLELVVCGVLQAADDGSSRNQAILARLGKGTLARNVVQSKHHRWKLDRTQIAQYQLERQFDPAHGWWEAIDVSDRQIAFGVARNDAVFAALICEDLARFDPVLPVLNSVGPNLVVALLMDGPQLRERWPGRYATVLAEDPGSSVLTVTCLGMVKLARRHGEEVRRVIGLWKDRDTGATELLLPQGALALTLSLRVKWTTQTTMDLRTDNETALSLSLAEVLSVSLPHPPAWLAKA